MIAEVAMLSAVVLVGHGINAFIDARKGSIEMAKKGETPSGAPTAAARENSGGGKGMRKGSFPVENSSMGKKAINLRGHAPDPSAVLDKVSRFASKTGDEGLKNRIAAARKKDSNG